MKQLKILIILFFCGTKLLAANENNTLQQANQFYTQKEYQNAIELYESVLKKNDALPELHYNLANAYYKNNQLGKAILHFEKTLYYDDANADAAYNLKVVLKKQKDNVIPLPELAISKKATYFFYKGNENRMAVLAIVFCWVALVFGLLFLFVKSFRLIGFYGGILAIILALVFMFFAMNRTEKRTDAILTTNEAKLHVAPSEQSQTIFTFHEGMKFKILDQIKGWYKVKLVDGKTGWTNQCGEKI